MKNKQLSEYINKAIIDLLSDAVINEINRRSIKNSCIIVVLTGTDFSLYPLIIHQLNQLSEHHSVTLIFSHSAKPYLIKNYVSLIELLPRVNIDVEPDINNIVNSFDVLLLPELSCNSLIKCVNGMADNFASELFQQAIIKQKSIFATLQYWDRVSPAIPASYQLMIENQIKQLSLFNTIIVPLDSINESIYQTITDIKTKFKNANPKTDQFVSEQTVGIKHKNLITQADVRIQHEQSVLYIDSNTLITPLAADLIKQKQIKLVKQ